MRNLVLAPHIGRQKTEELFTASVAKVVVVKDELRDRPPCKDLLDDGLGA